MDSNPVNDIVVGGIDANMPLSKAQRDLIDRVDDIITDSVEQGNPDIAADAMNYLLGMSRISGLSLAKLIYTFKFQWDKFKRRDSFEDYLEDYCGLQSVTIKRYYTVWEMLVSGDIPKDYSDKMKNMPIKCLVPIGTMWAQGWEPEPSQWMKLANAPDASTIGKIIREIKGVEPKEGSLQLNLEKDGTINAWVSGTRYFVGHLNVDDDNEIVQKAIARLIGDGRVLVK